MSKGFHIPFYVMPHWISVINIVKRYQLNSTGINFPFTGFLTAKCWLKIFGEYSKEILKVFPFSKFLNWFAKNAKNCHLPKIRWPFSEFVFYRIRYVWFVKGWVTYRFSYAKRHNDAEGWGYHEWHFEIRKNYRISKLMNCHELSMNCVLVY